MYSQVNTIFLLFFLSLALRVYLKTFSSQRLQAPSAEHLLFRIQNGKCVACSRLFHRAPLQTWKTYKERITLPSRIHSTISTLESVSTSMKVPAPCLLAYPNMLDSLSGNVRLVLNIGVPASSNFLPSMHIRPWVELYVHCLCKRFAPDHCGPTTTEPQIYLPSKGYLTCPLDPEVNKRTPLDLSLGNKSMQFIPRVPENGTCSFRPNSVATLRGSYGRCYGQVFNRGGIRRVGHFSFQFPHNMALVKCPCVFRLWRLAQNAGPGRPVRHFPCKFPYKMALVRSPMEPSRHFGPVSLSLWACRIALVAAGAHWMVKEI